MLRAVLSHDQVSAYLARLGVSHPEEPSLAALQQLMAAHVAAVPFENLSVHLKEDVAVEDVHSLVHKVTARNRGGFCYELNGAFAALLAALGFHTAILAGRVNDPNTGKLGALFDHLVVRVEIGGRAYLADVGFGRFAQAPLDLQQAEPQSDRFGAFEVAETEAGNVDVLCDGKVIYQFEQQPRQRCDFVPHCWWHATCPASPFTQVCLPLLRLYNVCAVWHARAQAAGKRATIHSVDLGVLQDGHNAAAVHSLSWEECTLLPAH